MGPSVAEMEIEDRASGSLIVFAADKASDSAFNFPMYNLVCATTSTARLTLIVDNDDTVCIVIASRNSRIHHTASSTRKTQVKIQKGIA